MNNKKIVINFKKGKEIEQDIIENVRFISFERNFVIVTLDNGGKRYYKNSIVERIIESEEQTDES